MNFNGRQSTSSCTAGNSGYEPFMLGNSQYGVGVGPSVSAGSLGRRHSVRDCMQWDDLAAGMQGNVARMSRNAGGGFWNSGSPSGMMNSASSMGFNYTQPKAFVSVAGAAGEGGSSSGGVPIPCQIAPLGTNPASLLKPMNPVTLRVTAPTPTMNSKGGTGPYVFTMDPAQIYGNMGR